MKADGYLLYSTGKEFVSINSDGSAAYIIDIEKKTCVPSSVKGSRLTWINEYIYYYDQSGNLCRSRADGKAETVVSASYFNGFRAPWTVSGGTVYFAGLNSDTDGKLYSTKPGSGSVNTINPGKGGIRDFAVTGKYIYFATTKGEMYRSALDGSNAELIGKHSYYHLCTDEGCSFWADMNSSEVHMFSDSANNVSVSVSETVSDLCVVDGYAYYRAGNSYGYSKL